MGSEMRLNVLTIIVLTSACGAEEARGRSESRADVPEAECAAPSTDSARAVCAALDTVAKLNGLKARLLEVTRDERGYCVRTRPADAGVLDGGGAVLVDHRGAILSVVVTDSAACPLAEPVTPGDVPRGVPE
jgi:hypothetical protein